MRAQPIEDYALIGDLHTAALIGRNGSVDWLCFPRFDSGACFAALLGEAKNGRWLIAPDTRITAVSRRYRDGSLVLETLFATEEGEVRLIDFMPLSDHRWDMVRIVEGVRGKVPVHMELIVRFDYGSILPWVRRSGEILLITAGPDTLELAASVAVQGENMHTVARFEIEAGRRETFVLNYRPSHLENLAPIDALEALRDTEKCWASWAGKCRYAGRWQREVARSLTVLKGLTYKPTGGMVAAPTTSLPEKIGGVRNWDYRFCWLRDATFMLNALLLSGYHEEANAWQAWLLRAIAGSACDMQILYSVTGVRRLDEIELPWLKGYEKSSPVRIGNAASKQVQLDVYGEVMDTLHLSRAAGMLPHPDDWNLQVEMLKYLAGRWQEPDDGIWEVRGPPRHFTHSKVMAWVAFDRAIKDAEDYGLQGPLDEWKQIRAQIHTEVCARGFDGRLGSFVQSFDASELDASLLLIPQVGFLQADDPRVIGTVEAIEKHLVVEGFVLRYSTEANVDALPAGEGAFLPCSFWLADALMLIGRRAEAEALFERLLGLCNDVGLLAEEYDPRSRRMLGNFPQALSHMALVNTARLLSMPTHAAQGAVSRGERPTAARVPDLH